MSTATPIAEPVLQSRVGMTPQPPSNGDSSVRSRGDLGNSSSISSSRYFNVHHNGTNSVTGGSLNNTLDGDEDFMELQRLKELRVSQLLQNAITTVNTRRDALNASVVTWSVTLEGVGAGL